MAYKHGPQEASTHGLQRGRAIRRIGMWLRWHPCEVVAFCMVRRTTHPHPIGRGRWTSERVAAGERFHKDVAIEASGLKHGCVRFGCGLALAEQPRPLRSQASRW